MDRSENAEVGVPNVARDAVSQDLRPRLGLAWREWRAWRCSRETLVVWSLRALVAVVALMFSVHDLGAASVWYDESVSFQLARQPMWNLLRYLAGPHGDMAVYYLVLHFWLQITGWVQITPTEQVLRLPSAIFAAVSAIVVFFLGRRLSGTTAGLLAAALYIPNFLLLYAAQQARSYSLQLVLICIGWYALVAALQNAATEERRTRWWLWYSVAMTLSIYDHLYSVIILAAQMAFFAGLLVLPGPWQAPARRSVRAMVKCVVVIGAVSLPLVMVATLRGGASQWIAPARVGDLFALLVIITQGGLYLPLLSAVCLLTLVAAVILWWRRMPSSQGRAAEATGHGSKRLPPGVFALACWAVVPVGLTFLATQPGFNLHLFYFRYLMVIVPAVCLLAGIGLTLVRWPVAQISIAVVLVALAFEQAPRYFAQAQHQEFRSPSAWLEQHYIAGDGLACYPSLLCVAPMDYYLTVSAGLAHFDTDSPGYYNWTYVRLPNVLAIRGSDVPLNDTTLAAYAAKHQRIFLLDAPVATPDPTDPTLTAARTWLEQHHYHLITNQREGAVDIWLYAATGSS